MAEIQLNVLIKQCLDRRIDKIAEMRDDVAVWQERQNNGNSTIDWWFSRCPNQAQTSIPDT